MTGLAARSWRALTSVGTAGAIGLTGQALLNLRRLRRPQDEPDAVPERVSVLVPARDEARRVGGCVAALLEQIQVPDLEILVLDDGSSDGTAAVAASSAGSDPRVRVLTGAPLPVGWLGKSFACEQLAAAATGSVLVFVDADVRLAPHAVAAAVGLLRSTRLDLVSPYPRQLAVTAAERLVQPLLQWSFLSTLPLGLAERSSKASLSAANGQFLVLDAEAYRRAGGHRAIRAEVLEDVALLRALKRAGGHGVVVDGTGLARCRMYDDWPALRDGYTKSLWSAFGSGGAAAAVVGALAICYLVPPLAALGGSPVGLAGYAAAVAGRYAVAERTGGRSLPDAFGHPVSIALFGWLTARSLRARRGGQLSWRGRVLPG